MHLAGVDGCRDGWLCIEERNGRLAGHVFKSLANPRPGLSRVPLGRG